MIATPFYPMVPKGLNANLAFRQKLLAEAKDSRQRQQEIWIMCRRDPLFYINTFCWTFDPRLKATKEVPFITYKEFQDGGVSEVISAIGDHDLVVEKSRDMGVSWFCLAAFDWNFIFNDHSTFLLLSKKEDFVDMSDNPDCLFWKLDFMHAKLPGWLRPNVERARLRMKNHNNDSVITGDSTTADAGRGGRYLAVFCDEFATVEEGDGLVAALVSATPAVIYNSTPKGQANAFYKKRKEAAEGKSRTKLLSLHWPKHPVKARGLYYDADGKPRSPWYDDECKRLGHPALIAQELDIDYLGSGYQFFDNAMLDRIQRELVRAPYMRGDIEFDHESLEVRQFTPNANGPLLLWMYLDAQGKPPLSSDVVLGVDIATGTGSSNSVVSGACKKTGEKILEYANPRMSPEALGKYCVALARWLNALLIWEANGPGRIFGNTVVELNYRKIFYRTKENSISKKISDTPGWYSTKDTKLELLGRYRSALNTGEYINRSEYAVDEARNYVFLPNGIVAHSSSSTNEDPTGASDNHGDRVIADALSCRALKDVSKPSVQEPEIPPHSFAARRVAYEVGKNKKASW